MSDPFRERRLRPDEVRRVLRRALEQSEHDAARSAGDGSVTREELERAASDLGIPAYAIADALARDDGTDADEKSEKNEKNDNTELPHSAILGAPTRISFEIEVPGEPDDAELEDLVDDIRDVVGETGLTETIGKTTVWRMDRPYQGQGRDVSVRVRSRRGRTRIVVEERMSRFAAGMFLGLGLGAGFGPMGAYIVAIVRHGAVALLVPLVWFSLMFLLARTIFIAVAGRRERMLRRLTRRLERRTSTWSPPPSPVKQRVELPPDREAESEAQAEAQDEAQDERHQRGRRRA